MLPFKCIELKLLKKKLILLWFHTSLCRQITVFISIHSE